MSLEGQKGVRVCRLNVVQLDTVMSSCRKKALIRRYTESVYLRVGMLDGSRADAGESLPESGKGPSVVVLPGKVCKVDHKVHTE
jgi:hypothetical protein